MTHQNTHVATPLSKRPKPKDYPSIEHGLSAGIVRKSQFVLG